MQIHYAGDTILPRRLMPWHLSLADANVELPPLHDLTTLIIFGIKQSCLRMCAPGIRSLLSNAFCQGVEFLRALFFQAECVFYFRAPGEE